MVLRVAKVCVPANTPSDSPVVYVVELPQGVLTDIRILIPPGHFALTGIRIKYGLETITPWHQEEWVTGDSIVVQDFPNFRLPNDPSYLTVEAYNTDEVFEHCFYLYFIIKSEEELTTTLLSKFMRWLGFRG